MLTSFASVFSDVLSGSPQVGLMLLRSLIAFDHLDLTDGFTPTVKELIRIGNFSPMCDGRINGTTFAVPSDFMSFNINDCRLFPRNSHHSRESIIADMLRAGYWPAHVSELIMYEMIVEKISNNLEFRTIVALGDVVMAMDKGLKQITQHVVAADRFPCEAQRTLSLASCYPSPIFFSGAFFLGVRIKRES